MSDFTSPTDRRFTGSCKWMPTEPSGAYPGAYPFSVADMEFAAPEAVRKAVAEYAGKGFYCYTEPDGAYYDAVTGFMKRRHSWEVKPSEIVTTYGIVSAINTAVRAFTKEGDGVIIQRPVYLPFTTAVENNGRRVVNNALIRRGGRYGMNLEELEALAKDKNTTMMILCSPHNPVGRVWTKEELTAVADICLKNGVILVSDEIHFDIVSAPHTVITAIDEKYKENTVVCTAASKTFNIAGLGISNIVIADEKLRETFRARIKKDGYSCINCMSYPATVAAYTQCDGWIDEMNRAVSDNFALLDRLLKENRPEVTLTEREGTYLAWLDISALGIPDENAVAHFAGEYGIIPNAGGWFGEEGKGYIRLNIAIPADEMTQKLSAFLIKR